VSRKNGKEKALFPLKKEGSEGFLGRPFQKGDKMPKKGIF
jgi:hypothetical protein